MTGVRNVGSDRDTITIPLSCRQSRDVGGGTCLYWYYLYVNRRVSQDLPIKGAFGTMFELLCRLQDFDTEILVS